jgi:uncharacterized protein (TIGR01777 family)
MKVFISGGSGFVGSAMAGFFADRGDSVVVTGSSRKRKTGGDPRVTYVAADTTRKGAWQEHVTDSDVVINVAGRNIFNFWTERYKKEMLESRVKTTENIVEALREEGRDQVFLSASAVGFYGDRGEESLAEGAGPGSDFLSDVCIDWETAALKAKEKGVRTAVMRFGIVLGKNGGALEKMKLPYKMCLGGPLGNGKHWFPWIHLEDLISAADFILSHPTLSGVFNFTSPEPVRFREFSRVFAKSVSRPDFFAVPSFLLETLLGDLGKTMLTSQKVVPVRLTKAGFTFRFPEIGDAIRQSL